MLLNQGDIQQGMPVLGLDGRAIGDVERVWPPDAVNVQLNPRVQDMESAPEQRPPGPDGYPAPETLLVETVRTSSGTRQIDVPAEQVQSVAPATPGYFLVRSGAGQEFYIPFEAVQILFPGQSVTLAYTEEECRERFGRVPAALAAV